MKLRNIKNETLVAIPKLTLEFMGWKAGDKVVVEQDKEQDVIILKRVKENK